jgi:drug/metabolite transporter (DMT)-like permease
MTATSDRTVLPVLALLFSATLWGVIWYPLRLLEARGLSGLWASVILYGAALAVGFAWTRGLYAACARAPAGLLLLALAAGWCNVSFMLAVLEGEVLRVLLLFYLSPLWATLLGHWFLGECYTVRTLGALVLAMLGALIMLLDPDSGLPWPQTRADWLALTSGFTFAVSNVVVRGLQQVSVPVKTQVNWMGVLCVAGLWLWLGSHPLPDIELPVFGVALALGALGILTMTLCVQYGVHRLSVQRSAVILLFELVAGALSAWWLADEVPQAREWWGGALIVAGAWMAARSEGAAS